ncbi:MAG: hypothetical protein ACRDK2_11745, partial [Solirubrobacteraceae bacterium]
MTDSPELTPDQRAVLSLLLRQHKSYAQVATMLTIQEQAVRDRAYAAIVTLGSGEGTSLLRSHREEIGDYLLGQRADLSDSTHSYLLTLSGARAWAETVRTELAGIVSEPLPELPLDEPQPVAQTQSPQPLPAAVEQTDQQPLDVGQPTAPAVSRRGGALLLAAILIAVIVAVVLIANGGGSKSPSTPAASTRSSPSSSSTSSTSGSTTGNSSVQIENQIN